MVTPEPDLECPVCGQATIAADVAADGDGYIDVWNVRCLAGCALTNEQEDELARLIERAARWASDPEV